MKSFSTTRRSCFHVVHNGNGECTSLPMLYTTNRRTPKRTGRGEERERGAADPAPSNDLYPSVRHIGSRRRPLREGMSVDLTKRRWCFHLATSSPEVRPLHVTFRPWCLLRVSLHSCPWPRKPDAPPSNRIYHPYTWSAALSSKVALLPMTRRLLA